MANKTAGQIEEIGGRIEQFAGADISRKVMADKERVTGSTNAEKISLWVKDAMDRLDELTDSAVREQIMLSCGYNCFALNSRPVRMAKARRSKYPNEEEFLNAEIKKPSKGQRYERQGNTLIQYYTPHAFGKGMRCYCALMRGLPEGVAVSPAYCQCSRGFVQKYWEEILGRPVRVELKETAITGAAECKFLIHL